jgi:hypothetical protein
VHRVATITVQLKNGATATQSHKLDEPLCV